MLIELFVFNSKLTHEYMQARGQSFDRGFKYIYMLTITYR